MFKTFLITGFFVGFSSASLPNYMTKCKFEDPFMTQCAIDNMEKIRPHLKDGIEELNLPASVPYYAKELQLTATKDIASKFEDVRIYGLDTISIREFKMERPHIILILHSDELRIQGDFHLNGQILNQPINGTCNCFLAFENLTAIHTIQYRRVTRDGREYLQTEHPEVKFDVAHFNSNLYTLLEGSALGPQMNSSEHWHAIENALRPDISDALSKIVFGFLDRIVNSLPLDELFVL